MTRSVSALALVGLLIAAATAHADDDLFTLTNGTQTISFVLPASPTVSASFSNEYFELDNESFTLDGTQYVSTLDFNSSLESGGLEANEYGTIFDQEGAQLYSGPASAPTFIPGTYDLTQAVNGNLEAYTGASTLTISVIPDDYFTLTNGTQTISFVLPASPTVSASFSNEYFELDHASFTLDGTEYVSTLDFNSSLENGGLEANEYGTIFDQEGAQIYSGSASDPTFIPGTYDLTQAANGNLESYTGASTLTISTTPAIAANTPEPSGFLLLGTGLIGACSMARKRFVRGQPEAE